MPRRRRQQNSLLPKVFAIAIVVNVIAVLVAAQFGALKAIQREFGPAKVVLIAPAEAPKEKEKPSKKKQAKAPPAHKSSGANSKSARANHPKTNSPAVVTTGPASGGPGGDAVADSGTLKSGEIPTAKPGGTGNTGTNTSPQPQPQPETKPEPKPEPKPEVRPEPKPEPAAEPKFVDAEPTTQPQPEIPEDMRSESLSKDYIAELQVGIDGVPVSAKTVQSTGLDELDRLALDAVRKWRFNPATLGGVPTEQTVRIKIQFRVQ